MITDNYRDPEVNKFSQTPGDKAKSILAKFGGFQGVIS
jgi:hypothetical protein